MESTEAGRILGQLVDAYQIQMSEGTALLYERFLMELAIEDVEPAIENLIRTSTRFPRVAEIREQALIVARRNAWNAPPPPQPEGEDEAEYVTLREWARSQGVSDDVPAPLIMREVNRIRRESDERDATTG